MDDNPVNQRVAVRMLEKMGHRVDVAGNGIEAVDAVARVAYAAVLMDCQMPQMDGFEATMEIRRLEPVGTHMPIIAMTAGAMAGDEEKCLAAGMDAYVSKPVKAEVMAELLSQWIPSQGSAGQTETGGDPQRAILDASTLEQLRELGAAEFEDLVRLFLKDGAARVAAMYEAAGKGDMQAIAELAACAALRRQGHARPLTTAEANASSCRRWHPPQTWTQRPGRLMQWGLSSSEWARHCAGRWSWGGAQDQRRRKEAPRVDSNCGQVQAPSERAGSGSRLAQRTGSKRRSRPRLLAHTRLLLSPNRISSGVKPPSRLSSAVPAPTPRPTHCLPQLATAAGAPPYSRTCTTRRAPTTLRP